MIKQAATLPYVILALTGALLIYLSAKLSFPLPGTDVPQSAQTLAIVVLAALLPNYTGVVAVLLYLIAGTVGLPVFSDGGSGISHLLGATGGYLLGFFLAALLIVKIKLSLNLKKPTLIITLMLTAHVVILLFGWLWLGKSIGFVMAFQKGVAPFITGGIVKSLLAAAIVFFFQRYFRLNETQQADNLLNNQN